MDFKKQESQIRSKSSVQNAGKIKIQALECQIRSKSSVQNAGKIKSRRWKAKSARIPASRMQVKVNPGPGKPNPLDIQRPECRLN